MRAVFVLLTAFCLASALGSATPAAAVISAVPSHTVVPFCNGNKVTVKVSAYGTIPFPNKEWVAWTGWLQQRVGSSWVTVNGSNSGWRWFQTSGPSYDWDPPGALIWDQGWFPPSGQYRVASRFYWDRTRSLSPSWEYTTDPCFVTALIVT